MPRAYTAGGRPRLGQRQPVCNGFIGVLFAPFAHDIGQVRDAGAQDERQSSGLQGDLVSFRDHPGISNHRHIGEAVGGLEGVDDGQHGGGLGFVALEGLHRQREPGGVGEQPDGDLRFQSPVSVSKYSVETSYSTSDAGPSPARSAHAADSAWRTDGLAIIGRRRVTVR